VNNAYLYLRPRPGLDPRAWHTAATVILIASPVLALATTAIDYRDVERRSICLAILLIAIRV
jgi:hypothetical protein